jgi:superfamily II DNA or RNA helicase
MTKDERQNITFNKVLANNYTGILNLCIRFGKTRIGLRTYLHYISNNSDDALIIVPSESIKVNWLNEIEILGYTNIHFNIITIGQALNNKLKAYGLLIIDECHKFLSTERYKIFNIIKYKHLLLLSGTLPIGKPLSLLLNLAPVIDIVTEKEAIENKWISNYIEYNIPLTLSDNDIERYVKHTNIMATIFDKYKNLYKYITYDSIPIFSDDLDLILSTASGKYTKDYGYIDPMDISEALSKKMNHSIRQDTLWHPEYIRNECKEFNAALKNRNTILISNSIKAKAVLYIFDKLQLPTICFNESINFANNITELINQHYNKDVAFVYHSKLESTSLINPETNSPYVYVTGTKSGQPKIFSKKKQLEYMIAAMDANLIKFISTVKSLDEGITIKNVECIITTSGSMNPIQYEQRTGRGKTLVDDNKIAKIYNLYFDDFIYNDIYYKSRDKIKLLSRQSFNTNVITLFLEEI